MQLIFKNENQNMFYNKYNYLTSRLEILRSVNEAASGHSISDNSTLTFYRYSHNTHKTAIKHCCVTNSTHTYDFMIRIMPRFLYLLFLYSSLTLSRLNELNLTLNILKDIR